MRKLYNHVPITDLLLVLIAFVPGFAAQRQIEVEPPSSYRDPVMISKVTVGGNEVQCRLPEPPGGQLYQPITPFESGDEWLQAVEIHIFNRTDKVIVAGRIFIDFPEAHGPASMWITNLDFGMEPANAFLSNGKPLPHRAGERRISLNPGQTLVVRVADYIDRIRHSLEDVMVNRAPTKIVIHKGHFFFSDGMEWYGAQYSVPAPGHPGQRIPEDPLYFPGNRENNWPLPGYKWGSGR